MSDSAAPQRASGNVQALLDAGFRHHQAGQLAEAEGLYRKVLAADPRNANALHLLGLIAQQAGRNDIACDLIGKAIGIDATAAAFHSNLAIALKDLGRFDEAIAACNAALRLKPDFVEAYANLGIAQKELGRLDAAVGAFNAALRIKPDYAEAYSNLGNVLSALGRFDDAIAAYNAALRLKPTYAEAYSNLGNALSELGHLAAAAAALDTAIRLKPDLAAAHFSRLSLSNYDPAVGPDARRALHAAWAAAFADPLLPHPLVHANMRDPAKRLKIGYVSPDFRAHSVVPFVEPLLRHHDRRNVEIYAYSSVKTPDAETARLQAMADVWRPIRALDDEAAAALVRADGIDVLVDLAGHTSGNRLGVFARKPAPVQATWLGYCTTTGMQAIDWFLSDAAIVPAGAESAFVEGVWRLPHAYAFAPQVGLPDAMPAPASANGFVTFGHFGRLARVTDAVLGVWARILAELPDARLALNTLTLQDAGMRTRTAERFARAGGDTSRLDLWATRPQPATWDAYGRIDIALDPFPFNAGATTFEALWLGVPVVTLRAAPPLGRMGESILAAAGLQDWVAADADAYVARAVAAAADPAGSRAGLRMRLARSALLDAKGFAANFEADLRGMWRRWCERAPTR